MIAIFITQPWAGLLLNQSLSVTICTSHLAAWALLPASVKWGGTLFIQQVRIKSLLQICEHSEVPHPGGLTETTNKIKALLAGAEFEYIHEAGIGGGSAAKGGADVDRMVEEGPTQQDQEGVLTVWGESTAEAQVVQSPEVGVARCVW
jgi:hypothetical protein